ncbi:MAG: sulfotransferase [Pseudomonadota bacterium]
MTLPNTPIPQASAAETNDDIAARIARYKQQLQSDPGNSDLLYGLGISLLENNAFGDARDALLKSISKNPNNANAHNDLGRALVALGEGKASINSFKEAVRIDQNHSEAWHNLGLAHFHQGAIESAYEAYGKALRLSPSRGETLYALAELLFQQGQARDGEQCLSIATQIDPNNLKARVALASKINALGYIDQAKTAFEEILKQESGNANVWFSYGQNCEDRGDREGAVRAFERALDIEPAHAASIGRLAPLLPGEALRQKQAQWEALVSDDACSDSDRALIGYGLGKALERQKDYEPAFAVYSAANAARQREAGIFERDAFTERNERIITAFSDHTFCQAERGATGRRPIFIVGMPRSGTTLTEQILSAHPYVHGAGELTAITKVAGELKRRLCETPEDWPFCLSKASADLFTQAAADCDITLWEKAEESATRAIDKSPLNFFHLGLIERLYPEALVIHCKRKPRDVCFSIFTENFATSQLHATNLADIAYYWTVYDRLMAFWRGALKLPILEITYEDTVEDIETAARTLCDFAQVEWDERCLKFYESSRSVSTPSRWQVRQPIYGSSVARWKRFEDMIGDQFDRLPAS